MIDVQCWIVATRLRECIGSVDDGIYVRVDRSTRNNLDLAKVRNQFNGVRQLALLAYATDSNRIRLPATGTTPRLSGITEVPEILTPGIETKLKTVARRNHAVDG